MTTNLLSPSPCRLRGAELCDLVIGQLLWLRDPRQTPVEIIGLEMQTATLILRILDFEDAGQSWALPFWDIRKFVVEIEAPRLSPSDVALMEARVAVLNRRTEIPVVASERERSVRRIATFETELVDWLGRESIALPGVAPDSFEEGQTLPLLAGALQGWMEHCAVAGLEQAFVQDFVSNPHAGETVKAHRMVLAELGLCPYDGETLRNEQFLTGVGNSEQRAIHILARLAFVRVCFRNMGLVRLPLYRVIYAEKALEAPRNTGFVSTTFSRAVADRFFRAGKTKGHAAMLWHRVEVDRVFMTCLETSRLSQNYNEAEAIVIFDPGAHPF